MRQISLTRCNALAGYEPKPLARVQAEEVTWFELARGDVVGTIIPDRTNGDYGGVAFCPSRKVQISIRQRHRIQTFDAQGEGDATTWIVAP